MERIGKLGEFPATYGASDLRLEHKGFLSIMSYKPSDVSHRYALMERGDAAFALPVDWVRRETYLLRAPRHLRVFTDTNEGKTAIRAAMDGRATPSFETPAETVLVWDVPAGIVEPGETIEAAAVRELKEETGIAIATEQLAYVRTTYPSIGGTTERLMLFIAVLDRQYETLTPEGDGDERMEIWRMSFEDAFKLLDEGAIPNAGGCILLQHLRNMDLQRQLASAKR